MAQVQIKYKRREIQVNKRLFAITETLTSLGYEAGFYDQAHFIKEFKHCTGERLKALFGQA